MNLSAKQSLRGTINGKASVTGKVGTATYEQGYKQGLAEREYETWTITLVDGSVVEKKVGLL